MNLNNKNKGSVLLLAIGLLTTMALLGTTFFLTSKSNRDLAVAESIKSQKDPIAQGVLSRAINAILKDSYDGFTSPKYYQGQNIDRWYRYVDSGLNTTNPAALITGNWKSYTNIDYYLASHNSPGILMLPKALPKAGGIPFSTILNSDQDIKGSTLDTGLVVKGSNESYNVTATLVDLSSKCNVNISRGKEKLILPTASTALQYTSCAAQTMVTKLSSAAASRLLTLLPAEPEAFNYQIKYARKFQSRDRSSLASAGNAPFSAADEFYLRTSDTDDMRRCARLFKASIPYSDRKRFTTFSAVRQLQRYPVKGNKDRTFKYSFPLCDASGKILSQNNRIARIRDFLIKTNMLYELGLLANNSKTAQYASQFAVNCAGYTSYNPNNPLAVPNNGSYYAVTPQLVFTEAFASKEIKKIGEKKVVNEGYAVEIYNPSAVNIRLGEYKLYVNNINIPITGTASLAPNQRIIIYWASTHDAKGKHKGDSRICGTDFGFSTAKQNWKPATIKMQFKAGTISLVRKISGGYLPADRIDIGNDLKFSDITTEGKKVADIYRDKNWYRSRSTIAIYQSKTDGSHKLGADTNSPDDIKKFDAACSAPVPIWTKGTAMTGLGDLTNIYLCALQKCDQYGNGSALPFPKLILARSVDMPQVFRGCSGAGRLSLTRCINTIPAQWGRGTKTYPNLPLGCLLSDFITMTQQVSDPKFGGTTGFGLININTASKDVLKALPFNRRIFCPTKGAIAQININSQSIVDAICDYRDKNKLGYRNAAKANCFLSEGEVAIPISKYVHDLFKNGGITSDVKAEPDKDWRYNIMVSQIYNQISGAISTRSDTFGLYIRVSGKGDQCYYGILSRLESLEGQPPKIIMFTKVRN